jgi:hypothetical protein
MKLQFTLLLTLLLPSSVSAVVIETFDATFKSALNQTPTLTKSTRDDLDFQLTAYTYIYKGNIKAELRTCTTSEGEILVSGTTTGGTDEDFDRKGLTELENLMKAFYKNLPPSSISDPYKDVCISKKG